MKMIYADPNNQLGLNAMYMTEEDTFVSEHGDEYEYDEFIGKWIRKRREKRASNPKVIERRRKRDQKRVSQGKEAKYPELIRVRKVQKKPDLPPVEKKQIRFAKDPDAPKGSLENPINNKDLKSHKVINSAMQNELKTVQEELKAEGLKKKVEQEDLKKENLKQEAGFLNAKKGVLIVGGVLATIALLAYLGKSKAPVPAPAPAAA